MKSIEKTIQILNCLSEADRNLGISELSSQLLIPKSTVHRILATLLRHSFVSKEEETSRYRLGALVLKYSNSFYNSFDLRRYSKTILKKVCFETGLTTFLSIWLDGQGVCIDSERSFQNPQMQNLFVDLGKVMPFHCAAASKVLLAYQHPEEIERIIDSALLQKYTSKTITDPKKLLKHLQKVKVNGFAFCDEELEVGIRAIAAPIKNINGKAIASITVSGLVSRITPEYYDQLVKILVDAANEISHMIGYHDQS